MGEDMNNSTVNQNYEDEIDLLAFLIKLKQNIKLFILTFLVGLLLGGLYGLFLVKPQYTSTAKIYLRGTSATISLQDLQLGSQLTNDYEVIFKSRTVLEDVIKDCSLDLTVQELAKLITISNPSDTRILEIKATTNNYNQSSDIANSVMENGIDTVLEIDAQSPYIVERAIPVDVKVNHSAAYYALIGSLTLTVVYCGILFIQFVYNDTVKSSEDIKRFLDLPVLTVVPEDTQAKKKGKRA